MVFSEELPKRLALAAQFGVGTVERNPIPADRPEFPGAPYLRGRKLGQIGLQIAVEEVEDVMPRGAHARRESGPGNWRERGEGSAQAAEAAQLHQAGEIRQLAGSHELFRDARIESIQPQ